MLKPYLLNPDGSYPNGMNAEKAAILGLTPVMPTPRPEHQAGMTLTEGEPTLGPDGVMVQTWVQTAIQGIDNRSDAVSIWKLIRDKRFEVSCGGVLVSGHWYHTDTISKVQHLGNKDTARDMLDAGAQPTDALLDPVTGNPIVWKTMGGAFVPMTIQIALDVARAAKALELAAFAAAEAHRAALQQAADPASYDFSGGWPAIYQGD